MDILIYIAMLLPAILMIIAGVMIAVLKRDNTLSNHHFAKNFNIKKYTSKVIKLFTICGIFFSLGGIIMIKLNIAAGLAILIITLIIFIISFVKIKKKYE